MYGTSIFGGSSGPGAAVPRVPTTGYVPVDGRASMYGTSIFGGSSGPGAAPVSGIFGGAGLGEIPQQQIVTPCEGERPIGATFAMRGGGRLASRSIVEPLDASYNTDAEWAIGSRGIESRSIVEPSGGAIPVTRTTWNTPIGGYGDIPAVPITQVVPLRGYGDIPAVPITQVVPLRGYGDIPAVPITQVVPLRGYGDIQAVPITQIAPYTGQAHPAKVPTTRYVDAAGNAIRECGGCTQAQAGYGSELMLYQAKKGGSWELVQAAAGVGTSPDGLGETVLTAHVTGSSLWDAALGAVLGAVVAPREDERMFWAGVGGLAGAAGGLLGLAGTIAAAFYMRKQGKGAF